jgi:hypothetical protein
MSDDKSRVYISSKTNPDDNFGIETGDPVSAKAAIVCKSDEIRVIAREGMKIVVEGGQARIAADEVVIESDNINLGGDGLSEVGILGTTFLDALKAFLESGIIPDAGGGANFLSVPGVFLPATAAQAAILISAIELARSQVVKLK